MMLQRNEIMLRVFLIFIQFSPGDSRVQKDNWCRHMGLPCIDLFPTFPEGRCYRDPHLIGEETEAQRSKWYSLDTKPEELVSLH